MTPLRIAFLLPLLVVASIGATWPSIASLLAHWRDFEDYRHGYPLAAIVVIWMFLVARRHAAGGYARPSLPGNLLLAGALLVWSVAHNASSVIGHQVVMPAVLWLAVVAGVGWRLGRAMLAPIAFLYFTIPVWDFAVPALQRASVAATESILGLIGVPADVREYQVTIPSGSFQIVEGCSGKRYFMVTLAIACLAAAMGRMPRVHAVVFVLASGVLAIFANWIRIVAVIYAGHATDMQHYLVAVEHETFGNVIFIVLLASVFVLARLVPASPKPTEATLAAAAAPAAAIGGARSWLALLPLALLTATFVLELRQEAQSLNQAALQPLPLATGSWQGPFPPERRWMPTYAGSAQERRAAYRKADGTIELYVNVYGTQRQGAELVGYGNSLLAPGAWARAWPPEVTTMRSGSGPSLSAFEAVAPNGTAWVIAYGYRIGSSSVRHDSSAQLLYGIKSLVGPVPSGVIALASRCEANCEVSRALVESFWDEMSAPMLALFAGQ